MPPILSRRSAAWIIAGAVAVAAVAAAVAVRSSDGDASLERVRRAGVLRVGYSVEAPFVDVSADGAVSGQSAACAAAVASALGVRIEWVQTELDRQIPDLLAGRFDVIGAGLFTSPERAE